MLNKMTRISALGALLMLAVGAQAGTINKSIKIADGETAKGASSVNGSVTVGADATVTGDVETVNGSIRIASSAKVEDVSTVNGSVKIGDGIEARDLSTVNGSIRVGANGNVDGGIEAVNGRITLGDKTSVRRGIENVNGEISLDGASTDGDISTVNGDITVDNGGRVGGDIIIEKPGGWSWNKKKRKPRITIGRDAVVEGVINTEREIELYIHESASVGGVEGKASMDDAVRFSGDSP